MRGFVLLAVILCGICALSAMADGLSEACKYVDETFILADSDKVRDCFNTYKVEDGFVDTIIKQLEVVKDVYPYVDISKNPPSPYPKVDFEEKFNQLKTDLKNAKGVYIDILRLTQKFVKSFHDGHFSFSVTAKGDFGNIFNNVFSLLPFAWNYLPDANEEQQHVVIIPTDNTILLAPELVNNITYLYTNGYYAVSVDGEDAFNFFSQTLLEDYNDGKTAQGRLINAITEPTNGMHISLYPLENLFSEHEIEFSDPDRTTMKFHLGLGNINNAPFNTRDNHLSFRQPSWQTPTDTVSKLTEEELREKMEGFKVNKNLRSGSVDCGTINNIHYINLPTFGFENIATFMEDLASCAQQFDEDDLPIMFIMNHNGGGAIPAGMIIETLFMPDYEHRLLGAFRKTDLTKKIIVDDKYYMMTWFSDDSEDCKSLSGKSISKYYNTDANDDFGNGAVHHRTQKGYLTYNALLTMKKFNSYRLRKNVRKPTDLIVVTDGFCFSACSMFVNSVTRAGSAIVAGFGPYNPGELQFTSAQNPSTVDPVITLSPDLAKDVKKYGPVIRSVVIETYPVPRNDSEIIPNDFNPLRIDKHTKYYDIITPVMSDFSEHVLSVLDEFKTTCNPDNQRLLLVDSSCSVDDPNALYAGHPCGANGKWDTTKCKISACAPGYSLDPESNTCVPFYCDVRTMTSSATILNPVLGLLISFILFISILS